MLKSDCDDCIDIDGGNIADDDDDGDGDNYDDDD